MTNHHNHVSSLHICNDISTDNWHDMSFDDHFIRSVQYRGSICRLPLPICRQIDFAVCRGKFRTANFGKIGKNDLHSRPDSICECLVAACMTLLNSYIVPLMVVELRSENHHTRLYLTHRIHFWGFHDHRTTH